MSLKPSLESLDALLKGRGIALPAARVELLWRYHRLLRDANERLNLTRIHAFESMVLKHYVDSLLVLRFEDLPSPLIDMGSGGGLPGIPLKIARPDVDMILAEPRGARAEFLKETCARLGLTGVEVIARKVGPGFPKTAKGIITRAVATIPETLQRVASCLDSGGKMLFMKGPECDLEISSARLDRELADQFRLVADHSYKIPDTTHLRRLVVYERLESVAKETFESTDRPFVQEISSASNARFRLIGECLTGKGIREHGLALISGAKQIAEVLARRREFVDSWIVNQNGPLSSDSSLPCLRLSDALFERLDVAGTKSPLLLVRVPEMPVWSPDADWPEGCTLFVPFQDPENVGAVVRSAAAFGVSRIVFLKESAHPFHPKAARAAGSALFQTPLWRGPSLSELDPSRSPVPLISLAMDGDDLDAEAFPNRFGLVVGLEGPGLTERLRNGLRRRVPIAAEVESLNAAVAAAIALYSWKRSITRST